MTRAKVTVLLLPGIGTIEDLDAAHGAGAQSVRIATHSTEADIARQHIGHARKLGHGCRRVPDDGPHDAPRGARTAGEADGVLRRPLRLHRRLGGGVAAAGGHRADAGVQRRARSGDEKGMHAHQNLSLGVANTLAAIEHGATRVDGSLAGMGAGAGNAPLEVLVAALTRSNRAARL